MTDKENQIDMKAFSDGYDQGYEDGYADRKKEWYQELYKWLKAKIDANYTATDILRDFDWSFRKVME